MAVAVQTKKRQKLLAIVDAALNSALYSDELSYLAKQLQISRDDINARFLDYNLDIYKVNNSIYDSLTTQFILHLHNLIPGSWHIEKQQVIYKLLSELSPKSIADIGFGVPTMYVKHYMENQANLSITLCDFSNTAISFAKILLGRWQPDWEKIITLKSLDMRQVGLIGKHDVYMFQDSIEHISDPAECLKKYVAYAPKTAQFILSLPIGPIIPAHCIAWDSDKEVIDWLDQCGLRVNYQKSIFVNLDVDLFAEPLGEHHHDLVVSCSIK